MTVGDLIEILQEYPSDTEVYIEGEGKGDFCEPAVEYDDSKQSIIIW